MKKLAFIAYPVVAVLSLAAAGAAFAEDGTIDTTAQTLSLKSREQVRAELFQARADGSIKVSSNQYNPLVAAQSLKTRDEVRSEALAARGVALYGEDSGSFALQRVKPARVAAPVYAQVAR